MGEHTPILVEQLPPGAYVIDQPGTALRDPSVRVTVWAKDWPVYRAAPDLLAALEEAFPTDTAGSMFVDDEAVRRARAAITKAKGEA